MGLGQTLRLGMVVFQQPVQAVVVHQQPVQKAAVRRLMPWLMVRVLWLGLMPEALKLRLLLMHIHGHDASADASAVNGEEQAAPSSKKRGKQRASSKKRGKQPAGASQSNNFNSGEGGGEKAATAKGRKKAAAAKRKKKAATAKAKEADFGLRDWFKFGQDAPVQLRKRRLKALKKNSRSGALSKQRHRKAAAQPAALPVRPLGVPRLSGGLSSFFSAVIHLPPVAAMVCPVSACGKPGAFMSLAARVLKPVYGSGPMKPLVDAAEKVISTYGHGAGWLGRP